MKTELRLTVAAVAAILPLLSASATQTINFGPAPLGPPDGPVADGYAGFDWHGAQNDVFFDQTSSGFGSAFITEMSRSSAFDLDTVTFSALESDTPSPFEIVEVQTTISGYLNGTLVGSVIETYSPVAAFSPLTLNLDGVNDVKFKSVEIRTVLDEPGNPTFTGPDLTMVTQMTVDNSTGTNRAPELDAASTASALTLLFGTLMVMGGRRARSRADSR
jgi:hypothetical protein